MEHERVVIPVELRGHVIVTGADGEVLETEPAENVVAMLTEAMKSERVVLHFHGGLVPEKSGLAIACNLLPVYKAAGNAYPVFVVWKSGPTEILQRNLEEILREELFNSMLQPVIRWTVGKIRAADGSSRAGEIKAALPTIKEIESELGRSDRDAFADLPPVPDEGTTLNAHEQSEFEFDIEHDYAIQRGVLGALLAAGHDLPAGSRAAALGIEPKPSLMDPVVLGELAVEEGIRPLGSMLGLTFKLLKVVHNVLRRYADQVDHGLYPTVVEEIARELYVAHLAGALWHAMKTETRDTFLDGKKPRAGRLIVDALYAAAQGRFPRVTLVGHSTGAVYINNLLNEVRRRASAGEQWPDSGRFTVALLAPACTSADFADMLDSSEELIESLRIFTMDDATECEDKVAGLLYPRSLLYLVSGLAEREDRVSALAPVVGLERYLKEQSLVDRLLSSPRGERAKLKRTREFLLSVPRVVCSPSVVGAPEGWRAGARKHGDFDDDPLVRESLQAMIRGGR